jgi:hypothetical protein
MNANRLPSQAVAARRRRSTLRPGQSGLIGLGRIDSGIEALDVPGSLKVTIERVGK